MHVTQRMLNKNVMRYSQASEFESVWDNSQFITEAILKKNITSLDLCYVLL